MRNAEDVLRSLAVYVSDALGEEWEVRWDGAQEAIKLPYARVTKVGNTLWTGPAVRREASQPFALRCHTEPPETAEEAELQAIRLEEAMTQAVDLGNASRFSDPEDAPVVTSSGSGAVLASVEFAYALMDRWGNSTAASPWSDPEDFLDDAPLEIEMPSRGLGYRVYARTGGDEGLFAVTNSPLADYEGNVLNENEPAPTTNTSRLGSPRRIPLYDWSTKADHFNDPSDADRAHCDYMKVMDFGVNPVRDPDDPRRIMVTADFRLTWARSGFMPPPGPPVEELTTEYAP